MHLFPTLHVHVTTNLMNPALWRAWQSGGQNF